MYSTDTATGPYTDTRTLMYVVVDSWGDNNSTSTFMGSDVYVSDTAPHYASTYDDCNSDEDLYYDKYPFGPPPKVLNKLHSKNIISPILFRRMIDSRSGLKGRTIRKRQGRLV